MSIRARGDRGRRGDLGSGSMGDVPGPSREGLPGNTAQLRVYEPMAAFSPAERGRWERYAEATRLEGVGLDAARAEHSSALAAAVRPTLAVPEEHALLRTYDGLSFVCPLDTQRRIWEAVIEFRTGLAEVIADAFVPRALADDAETQLAAWREDTQARPPHVVSATWQVPLHWFLLVDADERELVLGAGREDPERSLRYPTTMAAARRRSARALNALQKAIPESPTVKGLDLVARWLEEFHPHSRVELDYGDLVHLVPEGFLESDTSVADIAEGLDKLTAGDLPGAAAAHERVVRRWSPVSALENAS